jgi:hypothetical protein
VERKDCSVCDGEGKVPHGATATVRSPDNSIYRVDIEEEQICLKCLGTGYIEKPEICSFCEGTGQTECTTCGGSGEERCHRCEGTGKALQARVAELTFIPRRPRHFKLYKPNSIPTKYFDLTRPIGERVSRLPIRQVSGNLLEETEIRRIRVDAVKYSFEGRTYSLYQVGGKLKFDVYPRSLKKLATSIACFALFVAIVVSVVLSATKPVSLNTALRDIPADLGQFQQELLSQK